MSKVERKEYQETRIMRTRSPVRTTRSTQNLSEFDSNLDNLLEDLQSSVPRPGSSLGRTYGSNVEPNRSSSLNRISHMKASNPVTEYSSDDAYSYTSPDGTKSLKSFKKESYSYSTSGADIPPEKIRMQHNINQLDSLLDDLQQVKKGGTDVNAGIDPGLIEPERKEYLSKKSVQRELHYGDTPPRPSSRTETIERHERYEKDGSLTRESRLSEGIYGETRHIRQRTPSPVPSNTSTLSRQRKIANIHEYPVKVIETTVPDIDPEVLTNIDPSLRPPGNTKVTTTIKTYTYEIPGDQPTSAISDSESRSQKYVYSPTISQTTPYSPNVSQTTPSTSFVYKKAENISEKREVKYPDEPDWRYRTENISARNEVTYPPDHSWTYKEAKVNNYSENIQPYQRPSPPVGSETTLLKETISTRNYQPGYHPEIIQPGRQKTEYFYNENVVTRNYQNGYPPQVEPIQPTQQILPAQPIQPTQPVQPAQPIQPTQPVQPAQPITQKEVYIHKETHTSRNVQNGYPPQTPPEKIIYRTERTENVDSRRPPHPSPPPTTIEYKYSSHTTDTYKNGYPKSEESQPLLRPQPFPTTDTDGPPKKLDDLMATIGNEPPDSPLNAGFKAHEVELQNQKKVETLKQQTERAAEKEKPKHLPPTKNITGPPVYYPPGHEMFAKKEESAAAWRAQGGMAKASGKYEYEAESGSKTKTKSGAAIVPVCLPLCCGLPCVIL